MKYNVGDRVKIKSLDWYNENRDRIDEVACGNTNFIPDMAKYCGGIVTISAVLPTLEVYHIKEDGGMFNWTDEMIEGLVEEENANYSKVIDNGASNPIIAKTSSATIDTDKGFYSYSSDGNLEMEWNLPNGYIFKDENDNVINATKIVLEKKKKEYPKTYEECCRILGLNSEITDSELLFYYPLKCGDYTTIRLPEMEKFEKFIQLYLCRNAYWKIAGEEMGLGKPWSPDYTEESYEQGSPIKYVIYYSGTDITKGQKCTPSYILSFPTEEMRDAFYENFKNEIEICKELL